MQKEKQKVGQAIYKLMERFYPICSSITGNGVRKILNIIKEYIPLEIYEVSTGTHVFDWIVPREWNIKDAWVKNSKGEKVIDFKKSNLHVLNYSIPINKKVSLLELKDHLYILPEHPDWIPYRTSYYKENWGFCLSKNQFDQLEDGDYEVFVDSTLEDGSLTYGEFFIPGKTEDEVLISCYTCHPSQCNDSSSGVVLAAYLAKFLQGKELKYSYRFLFIPETIGSIVWLAQNEPNLNKIKHGLVVTCVADDGQFTYKRTRNGDQLIDKVVEKVLIDSGEEYLVVNFNPASGSDERQYCSPGINLPVGSLMRTSYGIFKQYHTSADNLEITSPEILQKSFDMYTKVIDVLETDGVYKSLNLKCEPQLGKRGLYRAISGQQSGVSIDEAGIYWVMSYCDGKHSLLDIAKLSGLEFKKIKDSADALVLANLLEKI